MKNKHTCKTCGVMIPMVQAYLYGYFCANHKKIVKEES